MKKLSQLLESINEIDSLLELDFKDKKAFQKYQSIHKMKPSTKVNIAGKETTVGDEMGDDSETPQAPKKTTGADIEKQASKSGKEKSDIEKDIMGDEPKSEKPKSIKLNSYAEKALSNIDVDFEPNYGLSDLTQKNDNIIRNKVVKNIKNTENFNGYIRNLYSELEEIHYEDGTISQEELSTLEGLELSDETFSLSDVPQDELVSKVKQLGKLVDNIQYRSRLGEVKNENFDLRQLSKITTRYTNRLDEAMKMKGVNGKMVEVPSEYGRIMSGIDRLMSKFNPRGVMFGYQRYHKLKPNDEFSGSIILKNPLSKKDIDVVMKHLKSAGSSLGFKFKKITFNPDRNEPFVEFRVDDASIK